METTVVSFTLFILKIVFLGDALSLSLTDSNRFVVVQTGQIPTSGTTGLLAVTSKSAVACGNLCLQFSGPECNGFVFQKTTCGIDTDVNSSKTGTCQLLSFASITAVSLGPSTTACQKFFVRQWSSDVTTKTIQSGSTSTTPLASTTTDVTTTTIQSGLTSTTALASTTTVNITANTTGQASLTSPTPVVTTTAQSLNPKLIYIIQENSEEISCITSYSGYLYVTGEAKSTDQIAVYNVTSFQLLRYITVTGATGNLYGVGISPNNDSLYVSDYDNNYVYKVDMSAATNIQWSVADGPNGLTRNRQNNLLVASDAGKIQEYTTAGVLVREITDENQLRDVKELSDGTLAISRYGPVHGVALLSNNGIVLYSYGSTTTGSGPGQMNWPGMLAVNSQSYFLVAESGNNRVLVLNPTLSQASTVPLPISGLVYPVGIWLDETRDLLYVGEGLSPYRLMVFTNFYNLDVAFGT